ncbi:uncharacterized protein EI97DRAFT_484878 [Westerdykella ornata]|uniref:Uncharacterized protein n=1 Tax=Westerdykella ornata TaxID=318751 RepID=A0A6A6JS27_WESOR|nr:uncharacterized protein EI97DRAFT_484878 [Westerdykella ornata]KAF2279065.1 hypothetical protein EI97DRAFT_484878 [Westerdykella ornata]
MTPWYMESIAVVLEEETGSSSFSLEGMVFTSQTSFPDAVEEKLQIGYHGNRPVYSYLFPEYEVWALRNHIYTLYTKYRCEPTDPTEDAFPILTKEILHVKFIEPFSHIKHPDFSEQQNIRNLDAFIKTCFLVRGFMGGGLTVDVGSHFILSLERAVRKIQDGSDWFEVHSYEELSEGIGRSSEYLTSRKANHPRRGRIEPEPVTSTTSKTPTEEASSEAQELPNLRQSRRPKRIPFTCPEDTETDISASSENPTIDSSESWLSSSGGSDISAHSDYPFSSESEVSADTVYPHSDGSDKSKGQGEAATSSCNTSPKNHRRNMQGIRMDTTREHIVFNGGNINGTNPDSPDGPAQECASGQQTSCDGHKNSDTSGTSASDPGAITHPISDLIMPSGDSPKLTSVIPGLQGEKLSDEGSSHGHDITAQALSEDPTVPVREGLIASYLDLHRDQKQDHAAKEAVEAENATLSHKTKLLQTELDQLRKSVQELEEEMASNKRKLDQLRAR